MKNNYALIIAGGEGTRFWPLSTPEKPKQFLSLFTGESMIKSTFHRLKSFIPEENIFVITNQRYGKITKEHLPSLPKENIILEPMKRNTFPAIAFAVYKIKKRDPKGAIIVSAADHIIGNEKEFCSTCREGFKLAREKDSIVTFGIDPNRPETNYGYLKPASMEKYEGIEYGEGIEFVEKPDLELAAEFLRKGGYFWNSGIFLFSFKTFEEEVKRIVPKDHKLLEDHFENQGNIKKLFLELTANSIDYVIMEKSNRIVMLKVRFPWDDVGNWDSLFRFEPDSEGNILKGDILTRKTQNSIIISEEFEVLAEGIKDTVFVENENNFLVSSVSALGNIKEGLKRLEDGSVEIDCKNIHLKNFTGTGLFMGLENISMVFEGDRVHIKRN